VRTEREALKPGWRLLGVPSAAGSLLNGPEFAADLLREAFSSADAITDGGNIAIPNYLPRHSVPPIRNWPAPAIVWDLVADAVGSALANEERVLLLGGDCSIVVGSVRAACSVFGRRGVHVVYIDGHIDSVPPAATGCLGAAAMGLWMLTHPSPFSSGPVLFPGQISVIGYADRQGLYPRFELISRAQVEAEGPERIASSVLSRLADDVRIVVHFDIDVIRADEMPAAYSPNPEGLPMATVETLLRAFVADERVRVLEVPEYTPHRDLDGVHARRLGAALVEALASGSTSPA
jgi:arginase